MTSVLPVLAITGLQVTYPNGAVAVRGVDLHLDGGETVALVGESGCGKTTIARAILGLLPRRTKFTGSVRVSGRELLGRPERELRQLRGTAIGYVAQDPFGACDPLRSVGHHVASAWTAHRRRPPDGAVPALLGQLGIEEPERRARLRPHQWSGGMLQRASIAAATALKPQLIVADEPTSALDAELASSTLAALHHVAGSILLVTHDLFLASLVADRVVVLYGGEVVEHGPTAAILARPRHPYTRALLDALPRQARVLPTPLPGSPPDPRAHRVGCAFEPRCALSTATCATTIPAQVDGVACHLVTP